MIVERDLKKLMVDSFKLDGQMVGVWVLPSREILYNPEMDEIPPSSFPLVRTPSEYLGYGGENRLLALFLYLGQHYGEWVGIDVFSFMLWVATISKANQSFFGGDGVFAAVAERKGSISHMFIRQSTGEKNLVLLPSTAMPKRIQDLLKKAA